MHLFIKIDTEDSHNGNFTLGITTYELATVREASEEIRIDLRVY